MTQKKLSTASIQTLIARLANPRVNAAVSLASTPNVAKAIIQSLPGVKKLRQGGKPVEKMLLDLLKDETVYYDRNLTGIFLHVLESFPSNKVKLALAKPIAARKFRGQSAQLAADTFLKAAGIAAFGEDAIKIALREAILIVAREQAIAKSASGRNIHGSNTEDVH